MSFIPTSKILSPISVKGFVRATTNVEISSVTYNNGNAGVGATITGALQQALGAIDNVSVVVGDKILVKDQSTLLQNGIYDVTVVGVNPISAEGQIFMNAQDMAYGTTVTIGSITYTYVASDPGAHEWTTFYNGGDHGSPNWSATVSNFNNAIYADYIATVSAVYPGSFIHNIGEVGGGTAGDPGINYLSALAIGAAGNSVTLSTNDPVTVYFTAPYIDTPSATHLAGGVDGTPFVITRDSSMTSWAEVYNSIIYTLEGSQNIAGQFLNTSTATGVIGTNDITFVLYSPQFGNLTATSMTAPSMGTSALTISNGIFAPGSSGVELQFSDFTIQTDQVLNFGASTSADWSIWHDSVGAALRFTHDGGNHVITIDDTTLDITLTSPILAPDGASGTPVYAFTSAPQCGLYFNESTGTIVPSECGFSLEDGNEFAFGDFTVDPTSIQMYQFQPVLQAPQFYVQDNNADYIRFDRTPTAQTIQFYGANAAILKITGTSVDIGSVPITGVSDPVNPQDAATKNYVDNNSGGGGSANLFNQFADVGNTSTTETAIYSYTMATAGDAPFTATGDTLITNISGTIGSASSSKQWKVTFDGSTLFDSTSYAVGTGTWEAQIKIMRSDTNKIRVSTVLFLNASVTGPAVFALQSSTEFTITGAFTDAHTLALTGTVTGTGAGDNQLVATFGHTYKISHS